MPGCFRAFTGRKDRLLLPLSGADHAGRLDNSRSPIPSPLKLLSNHRPVWEARGSHFYCPLRRGNFAGSLEARRHIWRTQRPREIDTSPNGLARETWVGSKRGAPHRQGSPGRRNPTSHTKHGLRLEELMLCGPADEEPATEVPEPPKVYASIRLPAGWPSRAANR